MPPTNRTEQAEVQIGVTGTTSDDAAMVDG